MSPARLLPGRERAAAAAPRTLLLLFLAVLFALPAFGYQRRHHRLRSIKPAVTERTIPLKGLPKEVLASFQEKYPDAKIKGQSKRTTEGVVFYRVDGVDSAGSLSVLFKPDGEIVEVQESTPPSDLPQFIQDSVRVKYPDVTILSAQSITRDAFEEYQLVLAQGKRRFQVVVSPSGKVFKIK